MFKGNSAPAKDPVTRRADGLLAAHRQSIWARTDRLFCVLLALEWLAGVFLASVRSPWTYDGEARQVHPHLWAATLLGATFVSLPIYLALANGGSRPTRHAVAVSQMLMSALLIHLGGGRIEMHFIIFGSFAFLAFYRDWPVLVSGIAVVVADHALSGHYVPLAMYGAVNASEWRTFEHAGWVIFENIFLVVSCVQSDREMRGIANSRALLELSHQEVERKVQDRTRELKAAQDDLLKAARTAGMAEIATSVLHNVGNVLNSVNVSATLAADRVKTSDLTTLRRVSDLLNDHRSDLGHYVTTDERGKLIPDFIAQLSGCLNDEHQTLVQEIGNVTKGIDHIKQIVAAQQSMAKKSSVRTSVKPAALFETALSMHSMQREVEMVRDFDEIDAVPLDEHKILQILINLLSNARHAVASRGDAAKRFTLKIQYVDSGIGRPCLRYSVTDNGVGIAPENLTRIFAHGFTTKREGHGFGLHSAANAAREMGGELSVASEGIGHGATFTLEVPIVPVQESTPCK